MDKAGQELLKKLGITSTDTRFGDIMNELANGPVTP